MESTDAMRDQDDRGYNNLDFSEQVKKYRDLRDKLLAGPFKGSTGKELAALTHNTTKVHRWTAGQALAWLEDFLPDGED